MSKPITNAKAKASFAHTGADTSTPFQERTMTTACTPGRILLAHWASAAALVAPRRVINQMSVADKVLGLKPARLSTPPGQWRPKS
ncbi:MAG: hypothetical protein EAZ34_05005, partial [Polaromonas sp.]